MSGTAAVFRALVLRSLVREKTRSLLTILGIAVGVAVIVAIELSNDSALRAFRDSVDAVAGKSTDQIVSDAGTFDESVLLRLRPLWSQGVRFAPVIDLEGTFAGDQAPVRLLGVDLLSDVHFRDYRYAEILTGGSARRGGGDAGSQQISSYLDLFRPDSVVLPLALARQRGLKLGSPVVLEIGGRRATMIVRGLLDARGPAASLGGSLAIADISAAQAAFGMTGRLSRVDLVVPEERRAAVLADVTRALPPALHVERPSRRSERVETMLRAFRVNLLALAGVALLVGMFLVYDTVLISILRRRRDVGVLKTLGTSAAQLLVSFLAEGLLLGAAGSLAGVVLGRFLASGILRLIGRTINSLYVSGRPEAVTLAPSTVAIAVAVGVLVSLLSAIEPSMEAAFARPEALIRPGLYTRIGSRRTGALTLWAIAAFAVAWLLTRVPPLHGIPVAGYASVLAVVAGFSLLAPLVIGTVAAVVRRPMQAAFGLIGRLASAAVPAALRRTAVAVAALSLATGMMVAIAIMVGSFRETVRIWVAQTVSSDLWLRPSRDLAAAQAAFPPSIADDLRRIPFIAAFDTSRGRQVPYGDTVIVVLGGDFDVARRYATLPMIRPDNEAAAIEDALTTGGVLVSETFSNHFGTRVGGSVTLPTGSGPRAFRVTGIYRDYSNDRGVVVMDRAMYARAFHDDAISTIAVYLKPGIAPDDARHRLETILGPKYHAFATTNREIRAQVLRIFDQTFAITYALLAVAIVVAVLGIVNTLTALILERRRELALLRVLGVTTAELQRMIVLESAVLGLAATAGGAVMGYVLSAILIFVINKQSFGWTIDLHVPSGVIAASLLATFVSALLAGFVPARLARRVDLAAAIKMD